MHVPSEGVPLVKDVTARGDVNTCGQGHNLLIFMLCLSHACVWNESHKMTATWRTNCDKRLGQES